MSIKIDDTPLTLEQVQAISDALHGRTQIRFDPDLSWTANKKLTLLSTIDAELALMKAERVII
jgi:hypothetical protein